MVQVRLNLRMLSVLKCDVHNPSFVYIHWLPEMIGSDQCLAKWVGARMHFNISYLLHTYIHTWTVPDAPVISVIPTYSQLKKSLTKLTVSFNEVVNHLACILYRLKLNLNSIQFVYRNTHQSQMGLLAYQSPTVLLILILPLVISVTQLSFWPPLVKMESVTMCLMYPHHPALHLLILVCQCLLQMYLEMELHQITVA